jgi:cytoskeletal protein CcmA (bactofilin family)
MQKQRRKNQPEEGQQVLNKTMNLVGNVAGAVIGTGVLLGAAGAVTGMIPKL